MAQGGAFNKRNGNRMMRWRVGLQGLALVLLIFYVWVKRNHG
jgi:hypothetical protein